jgi:hypothetical protein
VAAGAAISKACANSTDQVDIAGAITVSRALTLSAEKLPLEDLASTADGAERISIDDEQRGIRRHQIATARTYFIGQRFVDPGFGRVRGLIVVDQLGAHHGREKQQYRRETDDVQMGSHASPIQNGCDPEWQSVTAFSKIRAETVYCHALLSNLGFDLRLILEWPVGTQVYALK